MNPQPNHISPGRIANAPTNLRETASHEVNHILCGAAALVLVVDDIAEQERLYAKAVVHAHAGMINGEPHGEVAIEISDNLLSQTSIDKTSVQVAALTALGPVAAYFSEDAAGQRKSLADFLRLSRPSEGRGKSEIMDDFVHIGGLSPTDIERASSWDGPPLVPATAIYATALLTKRLGWARMQKMGDLLRRASNQNFSMGLGLESWVPLHAARHAVSEARRELVDEAESAND